LASEVRLHIPPGADSVLLPGGAVVVGSDALATRAVRLLRGRDYVFAPDYSALLLTRTFADTVFISYATLDQGGETVRRFAPLAGPPPGEPSVSGPHVPGREVTAAADERLEILGSKKLSLGVGDGGGLIEQSLSLSIRGDLGPRLKIEGTVTDRGTATDAITRRPSEFDKLSLRAWGPGFETEFGDTRLRQANYRLFDIARRLSGLRGQIAHRSVSGSGALGRRRGEFTSLRFYGEEGRQGPYALAAGNKIAVVPGSETVWLDGELLSFGIERDYQVDYPTGTLTFSPSRPITREARITVDYEIAAFAYNSFVYEAGGGFAQRGWQFDMLVHREWDDPDNPRALSLLDSDRDVLAAAGDSTGAAVCSGVDSVAAGAGSYRRDSTSGYFIYAGPGGGEFNVVFSYLGPGGGDYLARGDGSFFFGGPGQGDYGPVVVLPLPRETDLLAVRGGRTWRKHALRFEWAQSRNDANRLSGLDDGDNRGASWLGRYEYGAPESRLLGHAYWQHRSARFAAPGRDLDVEYDRQWGEVLGGRPVDEDELGAGLRFGDAQNGANVGVELRDQDARGDAWRGTGDFALARAGAWQGRYERLRRDDSVDVHFDAGRLRWATPLAVVPVTLQFDGERRTAGAGYRFREAGVVVGPRHLAGSFAFRRTDSLAGDWRKQNDLYRIGGVFRRESAALDGTTELTFEQRRFANFATGRKERILAVSRWLVRTGDVVARFDYRLSRAGAEARNEEFIPVEPGRGDYREEGGQIIQDPLGDLVRVVRSSAFGAVARQSEKRANVRWQPVRSSLRMELDVAAAEAAADAELPALAWLLPWQIDTASPTRRRSWRGEWAGGSAAFRWVVQGEWQTRADTRTSRPEDFRRVAGDWTLRARLSEVTRLETRVGAGSERERLLFPYDFDFALVSATPAVRAGSRGEISVPLLWQRYWQDGGALLADWQRAGLRGVWRLAGRGRLVAEPTLVRVQAHGPPVPLAVAGGRPVGTSAEWRLEGSIDLSGSLVGRLIYRGRAQSERPPVHRADISVEATF